MLPGLPNLSITKLYEHQPCCFRRSVARWFQTCVGEEECSPRTRLPRVGFNLSSLSLLHAGFVFWSQVDCRLASGMPGKLRGGRGES